MDDALPQTPAQFLDVGSGTERRRVAYLSQPSRAAGKPSLVFLSGFNSNMRGVKADAVGQWAAEQGIGCTRFDYSGHGESGGPFEDGTLSCWLEEARSVFDRLTTDGQVLIGSSMGGHIALLLLRALMAEAPESAARIKGLVLIAPAWNMTQLMWQNLPASARRDIEEKGVYLRPSRYDDGPYRITRGLIEDGRKHVFGGSSFNPGRPVRILHGLQDPDVPWEHTLDLEAYLSGDWTRVAAVPDGEHRLSRPEDIAILLELIGELIDRG